MSRRKAMSDKERKRRTETSNLKALAVLKKMRGRPDFKELDPLPQQNFKAWTDQFHIDLWKTKHLGVLCRGDSLRMLPRIADKFTKCFLVGQFDLALRRVGRHLQDKEIVQVINKCIGKTKSGICKAYNIQDLQSTLGGKELSPQREVLYRKFVRMNKHAKVHLAPPNSRALRGKVLYVTTGIFALDVIGYWKPKHIWLVGMDFYDSRYFQAEARNGSGRISRGRREKMVQAFWDIADKYPNTNFHVYTNSQLIKTKGNVSVHRE